MRGIRMAGFDPIGPPTPLLPRYCRGMEFFRRAAGQPKALGVFPGTFNPLTVSHVALAQAALRLVDEVVFVLPRALPHKTWSGASFDDRVNFLLAGLAGE